MTGDRAVWWATALSVLSLYEGQEFVVAESPSELDAADAVHDLLNGEADDA